MTTVPQQRQYDTAPASGEQHDGWLPPAGSRALHTFAERVLGAERQPLAPSVQALATYIDQDHAVRRLALRACAAQPRIGQVETLLHALNTLLTQAPCFIDGQLVGLPFSAFMAAIGHGEGGADFFKQANVELLMSGILNDWRSFLDSPASDAGFRVEGEQWLSPAVKQRYRFALSTKDRAMPPYWNSWSAFATRSVDHPVQADPFQRTGLPCALATILASPLPQQQALIDEYRLRALFEGATLFETRLGPYDVQRWRAPVDGEVLFDPFIVPGPFCTDARGLVVIVSADHGHVCCIPLGMREMAGLAVDPGLRRGARVRRGQSMGMFRYGGAGFAILWQRLPGHSPLCEHAGRRPMRIG